MNKLSFVYDQSVEHVKNKVQGDIVYYIQDKEVMPVFEEYIVNRKHYLEQIWVNVWVNLASNQVPRAEKKQYLQAKGYEVEGVDKKIINKLFRTEIKSYKPFPIEEWVINMYEENKVQWKSLYDQARNEFLLRLEEQVKLEESKKIQEIVERMVKGLIIQHQHLFFLQTRKMMADRIKVDFNSKTRYQRVEPYDIGKRLIPLGGFIIEDYSTVKDFMSELTGEIQKVLIWNRYDYEYEAYEDHYESVINEYLANIVPEKITSLLPEELISTYGENDVTLAVEQVCQEHFNDLSIRFLQYMADENLKDLMELAEMPFQQKLHEKIYLEHIKRQEQRKAEEQAELQRKKAEEARILNDIFEMEYNPPASRNVKFVLHIGETNTGKTYNALQRMKAAESGMYLAPLRLLALEVFDLLNGEGTPCSLKTGEEEKIILGAQHLSCTVEMFREKDFYDVVVIDEAQMISDKNRGFSWYKAITKVHAREVHIIASLNAREMLAGLLGVSDVEIIEYKRDHPLEVEKKEFKLKHAAKGDALICFSRKRVLETASQLQNSGHSVSMIYGSMPPETRMKQVLRFINGETNIVVSTDAIGMGLNLPIRRVVFLENQKFDGTSRRLLTSQEVKQIAGRAGRKGLYAIGKVAFTEDIKRMSKLLVQEDEPIQTFTIAPTSHVFERFQKYYRDLDTFFTLWSKFKNPTGTKKASLYEEKELFQLIRGTELEARLSLTDLYGLLHLPFSTREPELTRQWKRTAEAIVSGKELPEPKIRKRTLEELELSYKAVGLHLLFLYRLNQRTSTIYWERIREEISDLVHEQLKTEVKKMKKRCRQCNCILPWNHRFPICDTCYEQRYRDDYYLW